MKGKRHSAEFKAKVALEAILSSVIRWVARARNRERMIRPRPIIMNGRAH